MKVLSHVLVVSLLILTSTALADGSGSGPMMFSFDPVVAPDGTVLTLRGNADHQPGHGMGTSEGMELIAVDPSGVELWAWEANGGIHDLVVINGLVIVAVVDGGPYAWWDGVDTETTSNVVALTLAAGTVAWELELDEVVRGLYASSDRIYAVSGAPGLQGSGSARTRRHPGHGGGPGRGPDPGDDTGPRGGGRTLFAIGLDGTLLWSVDLDG